MKQTIGALVILVSLTACIIGIGNTPAEREKMEEEDKIQTQDIANARETCNAKFVHGDPSWDECMSEQIWSNHQERKGSQ